MTLADAEATPITEDSPPQDIVAWALERSAGRRLALTTAFGLEGCALIDMVAQHGRDVRVIWLDTMFLFPETYRIRDRLAERYPHLRFENHGTTLSPEQEARHGPELWRRDPTPAAGSAGGADAGGARRRRYLDDGPHPQPVHHPRRHPRSGVRRAVPVLR
jgi:3'-phosphoadenosine 5'-phosphosulfate sulfotransferase (PAPS reductase)/FAD synthetase